MPNKFPVPAGACDCHMHFFGTEDRYPGAPERAYTPYPRTDEQYRSMMEPLGFSRAVVVQPSAYGTDNRCTMDAVRSDASMRRAVAVIALSAHADELAELNRLGTRGIRFNIVTTGLPKGKTAGDVVEDAIQLVKPFGWHLQIFAPAGQIAEIAPVIRSSKVPIVLDHMGGASGNRGVDDPDFQVVVDLLAEGHVWVKVSGSDRVMGYDMPGFEDVKDESSLAKAADIARTLIDANPDNIVWGTDWPNITHPVGGRGNDSPRVTYRDLDAGVLLNVLRHSVDDEKVWHKILVDNPTRLYDF